MYNNRPQIKIGDLWSFDAWGLLLASGWGLDSAPVKSSYLDIPGRDGAIDTTEVLSNEPKYGNRNLAFELITTAPEPEWEPLRQKVDAYCNGQKMKIILGHDQSHYLIGRVSTGKLSRGLGLASIDFRVNCEPWRYKVKETVVKITSPAEGDITKTLKNERRRVLPTIVSTGNASVTINGITQNISSGSFKFTDFILHPGKNPVRIVAAEGVLVTFTYQEATL